ncbi:MAG TPA: UDP-N-acetylmuramate:L-alanyl-gamma-D-glutamyl-meso-diaminopimelate ligase [Deltaproteobacteria bacterium]|nr:UDP-N-acetylmuramate:L-alanyl-gamma-D-glutamyl-meso-diaminopimelate ligase [Deltaproteobacteria bacterium]|tara:strand:- start:515 stop:1942 length:1428 start_codon:yes stop_codon:yes gene_type:complete
MIHKQTSLNHIHFSGICGTAMGSLAVLLQKRGYHITGSDQNVYPPMSDLLREHNILVREGFSLMHLEPRPDLVVLGNVLSRGNPEVEAALAQSIPYISMAELLKEFFIRGRTSLVVTGTHGKTTTTSLLAWTFANAGMNPGFLIGGIAENLKTSCADGSGNFFITEGDEYDTAFFDKRSKFFHYLPDQLILNNLEFDHADIFASLEQIQQSFRWLLRLVPGNGFVIANGDDDNLKPVLEQIYSPLLTFGLGPDCDVRIEDIQICETGSQFRLEGSGQKSQQIWNLPMVGIHNIRNATAVILLAQHNHLSAEQIQQGFSSFQGVKRRQELRGAINDIWVYDDFAHHPTAVAETIRALRQKHPGKRLCAVFEPRSNTSVLRIHQEQLVYALAQADEVLLAPPHRAERISTDERLDVKAIVHALNSQIPAHALEVSAILEHLQTTATSGDVILIMSNGKFDNLHERLLKILDSEIDLA